MTVAPIDLVVLGRADDLQGPPWAGLRRRGCRVVDGEADRVLAAAGQAVVVLADPADPASRARAAQHQAAAGLPLIALVEPDAAVIEAALGLGVDDLVLRPVDEAELLVRLRALARLPALRRELGRRSSVLASFGAAAVEAPAVPERTSLLLAGAAGRDQVEIMRALGGGTTVAYAADPAEALERARRGDIDLVLSAAANEGRDAAALCRRLRRDRQLFDLPVLLILPVGDAVDRARALRWGVSDVLGQPCPPALLRLRVQAWVRQHRLRRRLRLALDPAGWPPTLDRLSGLYGHGCLHAYLDAALTDPSAAPVSVACFDVVAMAAYNRAHGYAAGDRLLAAIGRIIAQSCRAIDLPARDQGDRFCLVLASTKAAAARAAAARIASVLVAAPREAGRPDHGPLGLRVGVSQAEPGDDAVQLLRRAVEARQPPTVRPHLAAGR
jgi:two-component system cell cycle response regulator PopA